MSVLLRNPRRVLDVPGPVAVLVIRSDALVYALCKLRARATAAW